MTSTPISNAARLLRECAEEIKSTCTAAGEWCSEAADDKAAYEERIAVANLLEAMPSQCLHQIQEPPTKTEALAHYSQQAILAMGEAGAAQHVEADVPASGAVALTEYLKDCDQHSIVPDVGSAFAAAFKAGFKLAAPSAVPAAVAVPDGWKLVPCEPQDMQQAAGAQAIRFDTTLINKMWTANKVYREMVASAPECAALAATPAAPTLPDPRGCNSCTHPDCGKFDGPHSVECRAMAEGVCARHDSTPAAAAPLPLLVRDIARELGITCAEACLALKPLGNFSTNTAVTAEMMAKLRECFPERVPASEVAGARERMTAGRACYFMERFLKEEKLLGPNEQAALHFIIDMLEAAAAPVVLPEPEGAANLAYFSYDSDSGVEFHETEAEALAWCEEALRNYRQESPDGWPAEVESIKWGLVLGRSEQCDVQPIEGHPEFTETCDYVLKPYALLAGVSAPAAQEERLPWLLHLSDRADGVAGHYAIARWNPAGYREVWNLRSHRWSAFSDDVLTLEQARELLKQVEMPTAPQAQADAMDAVWLQPADMAALERFAETADDDQSFDISKEALQRLSQFGCLRNHGFGQYSVTSFGGYLLDDWSLARELPFKMQAERDAEHCAAVAAQAAQQGGAA
mgnify:FL=1